MKQQFLLASILVLFAQIPAFCADTDPQATVLANKAAVAKVEALAKTPKKLWSERHPRMAKVGKPVKVVWSTPPVQSGWHVTKRVAKKVDGVVQVANTKLSPYSGLISATANCLTAAHQLGIF
jgi:V8-like Glu-specific endopeptidase